MNSLNSLLVEGNAVRDAELKALPSGTSVCSFAIASNRYFKKGEEFEQEVSFFEIETWGKLAETCKEKILKGRGVRVVGRIKQERWTDSDGKARSKIKVVAERVEFKPIEKQGDRQSQSAQSQNNSASPDFPDDFPDDVPFN